jgi:hypothetical protein
MHDEGGSYERTGTDARVRTRPAPLCYSRERTFEDTHAGVVEGQGATAVFLVGALTCAAAFLLAYGGWV